MQQHLLQGCLSFLLDLLSILLCCRAKSLQVPVKAEVQSLPARLRADTKPHSLPQLLSGEKHSGEKHTENFTCTACTMTNAWNLRALAVLTCVEIDSHPAFLMHSTPRPVKQQIMSATPVMKLVPYCQMVPIVLLNMPSKESKHRT